MAPGYDLVIVGMGSGGMVAAEFAAGLDLRVAVVERSRVGGDFLWTGCVPSKALLASAKVAHFCLVIPTPSSRRMISLVLCVLACGRSRLGPPAISTARPIFRRMRSL